MIRGPKNGVQSMSVADALEYAPPYRRIRSHRLEVRDVLPGRRLVRRPSFEALRGGYGDGIAVERHRSDPGQCPAL